MNWFVSVSNDMAWLSVFWLTSFLLFCGASVLLTRQRPRTRRRQAQLRHGTGPQAMPSPRPSA